jgi:Trk-type K+ transport system membrane component
MLMITGRLGSITVFLAMAERKREALIRYPEKKVVV